MRGRKALIIGWIVVIFSAGLFGGRLLEQMGVMEPATGPDTTASYTLDDIYERLENGTSGTPSTFNEPPSAPGSTMHSLDDIMELAGTACTQCNAPKTLSDGKRWCDNKDGTITDMTTGLVWMKDAGANELLTWNRGSSTTPDALCYADFIFETGGTLVPADGSDSGDWRMPTTGEFEQLTSGTEPVSSASPEMFANVRPGEYWSGSIEYVELAFIEATVYVCDLTDGALRPVNSDEDFEAYVWLVRSKLP